MGDLSANFSRNEFACRDGCGLSSVSDRLVDVLEGIRAITGRPLIIVSGCRCPARNKAVGGASKSRHLHCDAADIPPGRATIEQAAALGAVGIGSAGEWAVHVDVRPGGAARWRY